MTNTNPKVSIIVPVYDAGQMLVRCLDSLIHQTLADIEIILITDCPTDGSDKICKEYTLKDKRIILIENNENEHIGLSRNKGLQIAGGEYIAFSDHDDYMKESMYEELYNYAIKKNAEMVIGPTVSIGYDEGISSFGSWDINENVVNIALNELIANGKDILTDPITTNIHPNLYKSSVIRDNQIKFVDTRYITPEDRIFNIEFLSNTERAYVYDKPLYFHYIHVESEGRKNHYKSYIRRAAGKQYIYDFLNNKRIYHKYELSFLKSVKADFTNYALNFFAENKNFMNFMKVIRQLRSYPFTAKAFRTIPDNIFKPYKYRDRSIRRVVAALMRWYIYSF
jgi:glycosyltransferase involved in cell wall biosynthesis